MFTPQEIERFKTDGEFYKRFRHAMENDLNVRPCRARLRHTLKRSPQSMHAATLRGSDMQRRATELFKANMRRKLAKKPWIADSCTRPRSLLSRIMIDCLATA